MVSVPIELCDRFEQMSPARRVATLVSAVGRVGVVAGSASSCGLEFDAALTDFGFETGFEAGFVDVVDGGLHHAEVHAADEVRVLLRELMKRTVPKHNGAVVGRARFETMIFERTEDDAAATR